MTNVVKLAGAQPDLLEEAGVPDDAGDAKLARVAFEEAVATGCSFSDCLTAVFQAGIATIVGAPKNRAPRRAATPPCPYDEIVATYHAHLPDFPAVGVQSGKLWTKRQAAMREVWKWVMTSTKSSDGTRRAETHQQGMAWFASYFKRVLDNDFLMGRTPRNDAHKNWRPDFDYLLTSSGMKQVIEKTDQQT